ncbi:MAG: hypothetical protein SFW35_10940 [Chitinophagales bacterium]|nr:hypothetical protein [Chitinophagales bacterium]
MLKSTTFFRMLLPMLAIVALVSSCKDDEKENNNNTTETVVLSGFVSTNRTLDADTIYEVAGYLVVDSGATLTIEPGTIVKFREGQGAAASALIVARNGKINAVGTADKPIVMTSVLDNITVGQRFGTNLDENDVELWGGLIILGNAKVSEVSGDTEGQIEGIPADYTFGLYGGSNDADNSGTLRYISIRHNGTELRPDEELQGLTLGGVGSGTTIDHIEVVGSGDDGVEIFGGAVNLNQILISYVKDDGLDLDENYSGTVENFYIVHKGPAVDNAGLEIDGPEGVTYTSGSFTLRNGTVKNASGTGRAATLKSAAQGTITNCAFTGFTTWVSVEGGGANDNYLNDELTITNSQFVTGSLTGVLVSNDADSTLVIDNFEADGNTAVSTTTVGGSTAEFQTWTWTDNAGKLD